MKKIICGFIAGIIVSMSITGLAVSKMKSAQYVNTKVSVDGKIINTQVVNVKNYGENGSKNYTSIRDVAEALGAEVNKNGDVIEVNTPQYYAEDVAKRYMNSCVLINVYDSENKKLGTASGVILNSRHIITNKHVVEAGTIYGIVTPLGEIKSTVVLKKSISTDIAVIELDQDCYGVPVKLGNSDNVMLGDKVITISSPHGVMNVVTYGEVTSYKASRDLRISAKTATGSSGGGVFNLKGELIGIIYSGEGDNFSYSIKLKDFKNLLR